MQLSVWCANTWRANEVDGASRGLTNDRGKQGTLVIAQEESDKIALEVHALQFCSR